MKWTGLIAALLGWGLGAFAQEIPGTKATLSLKDVPLAEAMKRISEASGNPTSAQASPEVGDIRVSLEAKDEPYWNVILDICEKNRLKPAEWWTGQAGVLLVPGEMLKAPTSMSGGCMVRIEEAKSSRKTDYRRQDPERSLTLSMTFNCEPKTGVIKCARKPIIDQAVGTGGESLAKANPGEPKFGDMPSPAFFRLDADLNYRPGVKMLKTLSGKIWVIREVKSEDWVVETDKAVGATKTVCDLDTLKITGLKLQNKALILNMEMTVAGDENLISWSRIVQGMRHESPAGQPKLQHGSYNESLRVEGGKRIRTTSIQSIPMEEGDVLMPSKLIIRVPLEVKAIQVPFEFHDVEMP
jgi:hypothetical protein